MKQMIVLENILKMRTILLCLFISTLVFDLAAQDGIDLEQDPEAEIEEGIPEIHKAKIFKAIEEALNEYSQAAKLYDEESGRVNQESSARFKKLFTPNAKIFQDYLEVIPKGQEMVDVDDYTLNVFNNLTLNGVEFLLESAALIKLTTDYTGQFYDIEVNVSKVLGNMIDKHNNEKKIVSGKRMSLKFKFDVDKDNLERATIGGILSNVEIKTVDFFTRLIGISVGAGTSSYNLKNSSHWDKNHSASKLESSGGLNYSFGIEYTTDRLITKSEASSRKWALSVGIRYSSVSLNTSMTDFAIEPFNQDAADPDDTDTQLYQRLVGPVAVDEELSFGILEIPLGVGWNLKKTQNSLFYVHLRAIPSLVLSGSGTLTGVADYDARLYFEDETILSDPLVSTENAINHDLISDDNGYGPYQIGRELIDLESNPTLRSLTTTLQVSPTVYVKFSDDNPGWGLMFALDLGYQFGSFIEHEPISSVDNEALRYKEEYEGSLLDYYTEDLASINYGVRIGLFQRFRIDP